MKPITSFLYTYCSCGVHYAQPTTWSLSDFIIYYSIHSLSVSHSLVPMRKSSQVSRSKGNAMEDPWERYCDSFSLVIMDSWGSDEVKAFL